MTQDINVLALVKGEERYIFLYDDAHRADALRMLGRFASNPELSFSWYDAAILSQRIRQTALQQMAAMAEAAEMAPEPPAAPSPAPPPAMPDWLARRFSLPLPSDRPADE